MISEFVRPWFSSKHRAKWLVLISVGLPVAGIVMAILIPACMVR